MTLHLIKLCVGVDAIPDLEGWIAEKRRLQVGSAHEHVHTTRMVPKRRDPLLDGGSIYWVIRGQVACRQRLVDLRPFTDRDGIGRCHLVMEPAVVPIVPRPCRPFQGWRYLPDEDAPDDLDSVAAGLGAMPEALRRELVELGLL